PCPGASAPRRPRPLRRRCLLATGLVHDWRRLPVGTIPISIRSRLSVDFAVRLVHYRRRSGMGHPGISPDVLGRHGTVYVGGTAPRTPFWCPWRLGAVDLHRTPAVFALLCRMCSKRLLVAM